MHIRNLLKKKTGASLVAAGLAAGALVALGGAGTAQAAACAPGTGCTTPGTATLTPGALTMTTPTALTWTGNITGTAQTLYDTLTATGDTNLQVLDLRGLLGSAPGSGWNITASATTFTGGTSHTTIPDTGASVLAFGGGGSAATATNKPSSVCAVAGCTPAATSLTAYPIFVPTGTTVTPVKIYNATAGTGTGAVQIGTSATVTATNPAVWSVALPASIVADTYTSTVTINIATGP